MDANEMITQPEGANVLDGLDEAVIGQTHLINGEDVLVYSADKIVGILMKRDGMDQAEALEFYEFNIGCLYAGERTPVLVWENVEING